MKIQDCLQSFFFQTQLCMKNRLEDEEQLKMFALPDRDENFRVYEKYAQVCEPVQLKMFALPDGLERIMELILSENYVFEAIQLKLLDMKNQMHVFNSAILDGSSVGTPKQVLKKLIESQPLGSKAQCRLFNCFGEKTLEMLYFYIHLRPLCLEAQLAIFVRPDAGEILEVLWEDQELYPEAQMRLLELPDALKYLKLYTKRYTLCHEVQKQAFANGILSPVARNS